MLNIAILDDKENEIINLRDTILNYSQKNNIEFNISCFRQGFKFLDSLKNSYDIVFLDIDMPAINGLEVAKKLRALDSHVTIIFVTNLAHCAINGYEVNALSFLVKPIKEEDLFLTLDKAISLHQESTSSKIVIKVNSGYRAINTNDIIYIEVSGHELIFYTVNGTFSTRGILKNIEKELPEKDFAKCKICYLVNLNYVNSISNDEVYLDNYTLTISRNKKKEFVDKFLKNLAK